MPGEGIVMTGDMNETVMKLRLWQRFEIRDSRFESYHIPYSIVARICTVFVFGWRQLRILQTNQILGSFPCYNM